MSTDNKGRFNLAAREPIINTKQKQSHVQHNVIIQTIVHSRISSYPLASNVGLSVLLSPLCT